MKNIYNILFLLFVSNLVIGQNQEAILIKGSQQIQRTSTQELNDNTISKLAPILQVESNIPTGNSTEVGITDGQLTVSLTGAATYNIPIAVPPGINGVVPQVSLSYNSQSGNGIAGYGWNISGVSIISKIPTTKFHDNTIDAVDFDNLDRFTFDGQRLVLKSGTYGADGAVYETENYSNFKITSYGVHPSGSNYGPAYFLVQYTDGSIAYYGNATGNTSNSRSVTDYAITYWQNPKGVRISYYYTISNNILRIASIKYGTTNTITPINEINFQYQTRQRPEQSYIGGQSFTLNNILKQINIIGNGVGFRNYFLAHNTTSLLYERLISITEKTGDNTKSYNPTLFNYDTTNDLISYIPTTTNIGLTNVSILNSANISGDYDGDSKMDFVLYPTTGGDAKRKFWLFNGIDGSSSNMGFGPVDIGYFQDIFSSKWLSWNNKLMNNDGITAIQSPTGTGTFTFGKLNFNTYSLLSYGVYLQYSKEITFPVYNTGETIQNNFCNYSSIKIIPKQFFNGDFNGDGLTDVIAIEKSTTFYKFGRCDCCDDFGGFYSVIGAAVNYNGGKTFFVDLDRRLTLTTPVFSGNVTITNDSKVYVADANGDGKSDLLIFNSGITRVYTLNDNNQIILLWSYSNVDISIASDKTILIGDYNGDGKTDFIIPKGQAYSEWYKYLSTGTTFVKTTETYSGFYYATNDALNTRYLVPTDFNNDGKTDLVRITCSRLQNDSYGRISVNCINNVNGLFNFSTSNYYYSGNSGDQSDIDKFAIPIFYNSNQMNRKMEVACINRGKIHYFQSQKDMNSERLLKSIITGNGVTDVITYKPLIQESCNYNCFYNYSDSGSTETYPNFDIKTAPTFKVVTKLKKISNTVYKKQLFAYYGAITNFEGLGFLGFRAITKTNWHDDNTQISSNVSKFDISLRGASIESYTALGLKAPYLNLGVSDPYISKTYNTYNIENGSFVNPLQTNKSFKLKVTNNQTYNGLENTSQESQILYDVYNNPTQNTETIREGTNIVQTTITNLGYDNQPVGSMYYIGRTNSKTQSVAVDGDTMTSQEVYLYNSSNLPETIKKKGHLTNFLTEENIYDTFGNITKKTITAVGLTPRITNYEYDSSGRFLMKSYDIEGLATQYNYNTSSGVLNFEINPYGLKTSFEYDKWFKKIKTIDYLLKNTVYTFTRNNEKTIKSIASDDGSNSEEVYDDLGRKIKTGVKNISGIWSYIEMQYDIYDRIKKVSEPYIGTSASQWSETLYDNYGRYGLKTSYTGRIETVTYLGMSTTVADGLKSKTTQKNAIGNVIKVTDTPGGVIDYTYFANGNLKTTVYGGNTTIIIQDGWGRKTKLTDSSAGVYEYTYNDFGEITNEITPNGTTNYTINSVGKVNVKTINGPNTNNYIDYQYDPVSKLLTLEDGIDTEGNEYTKEYFYDAQKRLSRTFESESMYQYYFEKKYEYDSFGRLYREYYNSQSVADDKSSAKWVKHTYLNGYHWQILNDADNAMLWQIDEVNANNNIVTAHYGNAIGRESRTYDQYGFPATTSFRTINGAYASTTPFMNLTTSFNAARSILNSRSNSAFNWNESFQYDNLDRLTQYTDANGLQVSQTYNPTGTIDTNPTGTYAYTIPNKPYQVSTVTLTDVNTINYYTARNPQQISYNAFKSPISINETGIEKIDFAYNQSLSRAVQYYGGNQSDKYARPLRKFFSADGSMEIKRNMVTGVLDFVTYIDGNGYSASIVLKSDGNSTNQNYFYLHRDYLGSILAITNASGQVVEKRLFDAWGSLIKYANISGSTVVPTATGSMFLDRGYTGHEHLLGVGLVNMNGRLYDPKLHRFLSPDNFVQEPYNTQNFNRYGYVLNNPLMLVDYSGESFWSWVEQNWVSIVVSVTVATVIILSAGTATPLVLAIAGGAGGFAGSFVGTVVKGGTLEDAFINGLVSGAMGFVMGGMGGIAAGFAPPGAFAGALYGGTTNALLGGLGNSITGGSFWDGFVFGGVSGVVFGGISGYASAKAQGLNGWTGQAQALKPKVATIQSNVNASIEKAKIDFDNAVKAQAKPTSNKITFKNELPSDVLKDLGDYPSANIKTNKLNSTSQPNSVQTYTTKAGKPLQLMQYNADGNAIFRVDIGPQFGHPIMHGHLLSIPGNLGSSNGYFSLMEIPPSIFGN